MHQENIYQQKEADAFFERNRENIKLGENKLRESKESIYETLIRQKELKNTNHKPRVLEIGCFIGDLLSVLQKKHGFQVVGIEPSKLACDYALKEFNLELINTTFNETRFFGFEKEMYGYFDLIIIDDVLSWMSREIILPCMASIDWLLRPGGYVYTRDFYPIFDFAYENHHQPGENIYNFKVLGGHKKFLLNTGKYTIVNEFIRNDSSHQKINTNREDSMIWSDCMMLKCKNTLQPKLSM